MGWGGFSVGFRCVWVGFGWVLGGFRVGLGGFGWVWVSFRVGLDEGAVGLSDLNEFCNARISGKLRGHDTLSIYLKSVNCEVR